MSSAKKFLLHRPRLVSAFTLAIIAFFFLPETWLWTTRALFAWNLAVWSYLVLMGWLMMRANNHRVRAMAIREDKNAVTVLVLISLCAVISVGAIVVELAGSKDLSADVRAFKYLFTGMTVLGSWLLVAVVFCFHYALLFYRSSDDLRALRFPDDEQMPDFWDFLYFSFTIAVAAQTSDVAVMSRSARKTVLAQSVLSFFFNVAVLGFSINIAASLVGN
ncbi:DUF1345 domain-containing protein [Undibacterium sp. SXout20W]|uniref:DUF1345 domain-containing protein n=1 Tax=Undibacterium sp. SXout20W TaxID=3413051 RepID=UPI003BF2BF6D